MADLSKTIEILFQGTNKTTGAITSIGRDLDEMNYRVGVVAQPFADLTSAVVKLDAALAALAIGGLAVAYNESSKFESSYIELKKVVGDNVEGLDAAKASATELSEVYGQSSSSILESTANYVQAGFNVQDSMKLAKSGMDLVIAGGLEAADSSEILVAALKGFEAPATEAARLVDILNEVSNNYATDVEQLGIGMAALSPIAKIMGFSMEETAGVLTPVIEVFRSGDEAAVALKTGLLSLIKDSDKVKTALASIGVSQTDSNGALRSGKDILNDVAIAFQDLNQDQKLFVTQQLVGINQAARMVTVFDGFAKSAAVTETALNSAGSASLEVAARLESSEVAVDRFVTSFQNAAIVIGDKFKSSTNEAINGMTGIWQAVRQSVEEGDFDDFFNSLDSFGRDIAEKFNDIAEGIPEAMDGVDFSGLLDSFGDLREVISSVFDGIDLSKPEDLTIVIQSVIDSIESITRVSAGIGEAFSNIGGYVSGLIVWFNDLDDGTKEFFGNMAGVGAAVAAVAVPVGVVTTAITSLTGALTAAVAAGSLWLGLKMADAVNKDVYGVDSVLVGLEKSAKELQDEIGKLEGANTTLYKFFKGEDKEVVLDELRTKLQTVNDKIAIVRKEASGENIFGGIEDDAGSLKNALEHIAPKFTEIDNSAKELKSALEHNTPKFTIDTSDAEKKFKTIEYYVGEIGNQKLKTIKVPVDSSEVDNAKKKIEEVPAVKKLEFETDLNIARIKAESETIQKSIEWKAKLDIANVEAQTERVKAIAGNITEVFKDTGNVISGLFDSWDSDTSLSERWALQSTLRAEQERRDKAQKLQEKLTEAEIKLMNARAEAMKDGESLLKIEGSNVSPHIEAFLWEILSALQIRATQEGRDALLLGG